MMRKTLKKYRLIASIALIAIAIVVFLLVVNVHNLYLIASDLNIKVGFFYSLLLLILILGGIVYYFAWKLYVLAIDPQRMREELGYTTGSGQTAKNASQTEVRDEKDDKEIKEIADKMIPSGKDAKDIKAFSEQVLSSIANQMEIVQGIFYFKDKESEAFQPVGKYAYYSEEEPRSFKIGETLSGQVAKNQKMLNINTLPDNYLVVYSGLGETSPKGLIILPVIADQETIAVLELASFKPFSKKQERILETLVNNISKKTKNYIKS